MVQVQDVIGQKFVVMGEVKKAKQLYDAEYKKVNKYVKDLDEVVSKRDKLVKERDALQARVDKARDLSAATEGSNKELAASLEGLKSTIEGLPSIDELNRKSHKHFMADINKQRKEACQETVQLREQFTAQVKEVLRKLAPERNSTLQRLIPARAPTGEEMLKALWLELRKYNPHPPPLRGAKEKAVRDQRDAAPPRPEGPAHPKDRQAQAARAPRSLSRSASSYSRSYSRSRSRSRSYSSSYTRSSRSRSRSYTSSYSRSPSRSATEEEAAK
eukprot:TRINITY_DN11529_c3_g1_i1.p1 TRINITY_DN11529_c3_g1~~TRINITY_DN11529_c3_g1_i1.p1  ORF type:complete len:273 (+),score=117.18 TRINITY_DN11529_c3_g1_i1:106-924(+)